MSDGDNIQLGNLNIEVIETPGHSGDHVSYLAHINNKKILFAGDLIFYEGKVSLQHIYDCNVFEIGKSIKKLEKKEIDVLLPGHDTIVLKEAQSHVQTSINYFNNSIIPPNIIY